MASSDNIGTIEFNMMNTLSAHQSQFIPWFPYFKKVASSDIFVWMDAVQYQRKGLQNRNKVWSPQGELWFTLPVKKNSVDALISEMQLIEKNIGDKRWKTLEITYYKAPYWKVYADELYFLLCECEYRFLDEINWAFFSYVLFKFRIDTKVVRLSELNIAAKKSDLILQICQSQRATKYLSGMGGKNYLDEDKFKDNSIEIDFVYSRMPEYPQFRSPQISNLSFLDTMMNCSHEEIVNYLDNDRNEN